MRVAVVGYGIEGRSSCHYWQTLGHDVTVHDVNTGLELPIGVDSVLGEHYLQGLDGYDLVVRTPALMPDKLITTTRVTTATNEFFRVCPVPIIGVTGTKGKGTTASLIASILRSAGRTVHLGGNIGTPMLDLLPGMKSDDLVVLELSSFQLIDLEWSPHVAIHLMMAEDHLDTHHDFAEYQTAKANIFAHQTPADVAVYVATDQQANANAQKSPAKTRYQVSIDSTVEADCFVRHDQIMFHDAAIMSTDEIPLLGRFNQENVCSAVAGAWTYVQDPATIARGIKVFTGLPHRMQLVTNIDGVDYVDDAIAVNPEASVTSLASFERPTQIIVGGKDKKFDYDDYARRLANAHPKAIIVLGEIADRLITGLNKVGFESAIKVSSMAEAVSRAHTQARAGEVVLLAPGTSSFDMYKSFADKGEQFQRAVMKLNEAKS